MLQYLRSHKPNKIYKSNGDILKYIPYNKKLTNTNLYKVSTITDTGFPKVKLTGTALTQTLEDSSFNFIFKDNTDYIIDLNYICDESKNHLINTQLKIKFKDNKFKIRTTDSYIILTCSSKTKMLIDILQLEWAAVVILSIKECVTENINSTRIKEDTTLVTTYTPKSSSVYTASSSLNRPDICYFNTRSSIINNETINGYNSYTGYFYKTGIYIKSAPSTSSPYGEGLTYSTDNRKTWVQSNITTGHIETITYFNGLYVAGGDEGQCKGLLYSTDGKTWTSSNITNIGIKRVVYANKLWVAAAWSSTSPSLYYSTDGKTWTAVSITSNLTPTCMYNVVYFNDRWIAASTSGNYKGLYYSTDGKTWTKISESDSIIWAENESWSNAYLKDFGEILICYDVNNNEAVMSFDGITWTMIEGFGNASRISKATYYIYDRSLQTIFYNYKASSSSSTVEIRAIQVSNPSNYKKIASTSETSLIGIYDNKLYITSTKYIPLSNSDIQGYIDVTNSDIY